MAEVCSKVAELLVVLGREDKECGCGWAESCRVTGQDVAACLSQLLVLLRCLFMGQEP